MTSSLVGVVCGDVVRGTGEDPAHGMGRFFPSHTPWPVIMRGCPLLPVIVHEVTLGAARLCHIMQDHGEVLGMRLIGQQGRSRMDEPAVSG